LIFDHTIFKHGANFGKKQHGAGPGDNFCGHVHCLVNVLDANAIGAACNQCGLFKSHGAGFGELCKVEESSQQRVHDQLY